MQDLALVRSGQNVALLIYITITSTPLHADGGSLSLALEQVSPSAHITGLRLSRRGDRLVVNCSDKCARLVEATPPTELHTPFSAQEAALRLRTQKVGCPRPVC